MSNQGWRGVCLFITIMLGVAACTSDGDSPPTDAATVDATAEPTSLKVMQFNIEYGGDGVDFRSVANAIEAADADVVAIQESYAKVPEIASDLGWDYYDERTQTVSKLPLLTPEDAEGGLGSYIYVEVDGGVVALFNLHLPSTAYGPNKIAGGATEEEVLKRESNGRMHWLQPVLDAAAGTIGQDIPTFVVGDFNAPSHRDWTEETVGLRDQIKFPVQWPTSLAAEGIGLIDAYRAVYPDPVEDEGLTWPASRPFVKGYNPGPGGKPADRIDLMYAGGPAQPTTVNIVGEKSSEVTDIPVSPWPSDHRAVVGSFDVIPGDVGSLVSVEQRLVEQDQPTNVRYLSSDEDAGSLAIVRPRGSIGEALIEENVPDPHVGIWQLPTGEIEAGEFEVILTSTEGDELARSPFWVVESGAKPEISTADPMYEEGQLIEVKWEAAPGNKWDWIGIYKQGADPNVAYYKLWTYTEATIASSAVLDDTSGGKWPLPAGEYSVYLMADDSYVKLARGDFAVTK